MKRKRILATFVASTFFIGGGLAGYHALNQKQGDQTRETSHSVVITADCSKEIPEDGAQVPGALTIDSVAKEGPEALTPMIAKNRASYTLVFDHYLTELQDFKNLARKFAILACDHSHMPEPELKKPASTRGDQTRDDLSIDSRQGSIVFDIYTNQSVEKNAERLANLYLSASYLPSPGITHGSPNRYNITLDKSTTSEPDHQGLIKDFATVLADAEQQNRLAENYRQFQRESQGIIR